MHKTIQRLVMKFTLGFSVALSKNFMKVFPSKFIRQVWGVCSGRLEELEAIKCAFHREKEVKP